MSDREVNARTLKMTVAYDGSQYAGWQVQANALSIQETMEAAVLRVTGRQVRVVASGRTDAGVHAIGQVVSCRLATRLPLDQLQRALNALTPRDICIHALEEAVDDFHAIRDAVGKRYRYLIQDGPFQDPLALRYTWFVPASLDVQAMVEAAQSLLGRHDFSSFEASGSERATSVRTIQDLLVERVQQTPFPRLRIEIEADGFLYNMVRNIVGSLVEVGRGGRPAEWMAEVLRQRDRRRAGPTAPPQGLVLLRVNYE